MIKGEAVATRKDGKTIKAAGEFVYLIPATAYSREWFEHAILAGHKIEGIDPRSLRITRTTSAPEAAKTALLASAPVPAVRTLEVSRVTRSARAPTSMRPASGKPRDR